MTTPEIRAKARTQQRMVRQDLDAASQVVEAERHSPAVSLAITSGINAKDAICLTRTGRTGKTENHNAAIMELSAALGPAGKSEVSALRELLAQKNPAQYDAARLGPKDSTAAIRRALTLVTAAESVLTEV